MRRTSGESVIAHRNPSALAAAETPISVGGALRALFER